MATVSCMSRRRSCEAGFRLLVGGNRLSQHFGDYAHVLMCVGSGVAV